MQSCISQGISYGEAIVPGQIADIKGNFRWAIVGSQGTHTLLIGRSLVDLNNPILPILNPSDQRYKVKKGTELALCEPVLSVQTGRLTEENKDKAVPEHLTDLYESTKN